MARDQFSDVAWRVDENSKLEALSGVSVEVFIADGVTRATIYSSKTTGSAAANPFVTNSSGLIEFWAERGLYLIVITDTELPVRFAQRQKWFNASPSENAGIDGAWIADNSISNAKMLDNSVGTAEIIDGSVTAAEIGTNAVGLDELANGSVDLAALTAALQQQIFSSGDFKFSAQLVDHGGWLLCDGRAVARAGTYASLFSAIQEGFGIGDGASTFNIPDLRGRVPVGMGTHADVNGLNDNDGLAVGSRSPKHAHTVANHAHTGPLHTHSVVGTTGGPHNGFDRAPYQANGPVLTARQDHYHFISIESYSAGNGATGGSAPGTDSQGPGYMAANWFIKI